MIRLATLALAAGLSACVGSPPVDLCKHAAIRRHLYTATIAAADLALASGRPVPGSIRLGREAAATALAMLDARCPVIR